MTYDEAVALVKKDRLVYTCNCGWVDTGHANPTTTRDKPSIGAANLWQQIVSESGKKSLCKLARGFKVTYAQDVGLSRFGAPIVVDVVKRDYWVRSGLATSQKESVALAIFLEVSDAFESVQLNFGSSSGFSLEDLTSNLIGFYTAVRPGTDYLALAKPIGKDASLQLLLENPHTFESLGTSAHQPTLYKCAACSGGGSFPPQLKQIHPAIKGGIGTQGWKQPADDGKNFRDWSFARDDVPKVPVPF